MKQIIIRTYWRDSRHPDGVLIDERLEEVPRKVLMTPELIPRRFAAEARSAAERERIFRNFVRRLTPAQRKFVLTLKRVIEVEKGPENLQRKKILKALKIKAWMHQKHLKDITQKHLPAAISGEH